jgi:hypothetical protein
LQDLREPHLIGKGGSAEVMRYLGSYLKSKPLILENQRIIGPTGYLEPERAFLTYSKELVLDDPGPGYVYSAGFTAQRAKKA